MYPGSEQHLRTTTEFLHADDVDRLAVVLEAFREMRQPLASIEPEPGEVKKRRFRSDRPVPTGYRLDLSVGVGDRSGDGPLPAEFLFTFPDDHPGIAATTARELLDGILPVGAAWGFSDEFGPESLHVTAPDLRDHEAASVARFVFGALRAFGAPTPTERWQCMWMSSRKDPEVPPAAA